MNNNINKNNSILLGAPMGAATHELREIPMEQIHTSRYWHRHDYADNLDSLKQSIQKEGLLQFPCVIEKGDEYYELICGHRRFLSCKQLGLATLPCHVRHNDFTEAGILCLTENVTREDLHPIDIAETLSQILKQDKSLTHALLGQKIGWPQSRVTEYLSILKLDPDICDKLDNRTESPFRFTHAVALARLQNTKRSNRSMEVRELQKKTIQYKLSTTELKTLVSLFTENQYDRLPDKLRSYLLSNRFMTSSMAWLYLDPQKAIRPYVSMDNFKYDHILSGLDKNLLERLIMNAVKAEKPYENALKTLLNIVNKKAKSAADEEDQDTLFENHFISNIIEITNTVQPGVNRLLSLAKSNPAKLKTARIALERLQNKLRTALTQMNEALTEPKIDKDRQE